MIEITILPAGPRTSTTDIARWSEWRSFLARRAVVDSSISDEPDEGFVRYYQYALEQGVTAAYLEHDATRYGVVPTEDGTGVLFLEPHLLQYGILSGLELPGRRPAPPARDTVKQRRLAAWRAFLDHRQAGTPISGEEEVSFLRYYIARRDAARSLAQLREEAAAGAMPTTDGRGTMTLRD